MVMDSSAAIDAPAADLEGLLCVAVLGTPDDASVGDGALKIRYITEKIKLISHLDTTGKLN